MIYREKHFCCFNLNISFFKIENLTFLLLLKDYIISLKMHFLIQPSNDITHNCYKKDIMTKKKYLSVRIDDELIVNHITQVFRKKSPIHLTWVRMCYVVRGFGSDLFTRCALISVTIKWQLHSLTMLYN